MPNLTMSIPHQLGRAEARRRIEAGMTQLQQQFSTVLGHVQQNWQGDTLHLSGTALAQTVSAAVTVLDQTVNIEVELPWMLSMVVGRVKQQIEQQGRALLGHKPS